MQGDACAACSLLIRRSRLSVWREEGRRAAWSLADAKKPTLNRGLGLLCGTAGVLTKLDIMDRDTDAAAVLRNEVVPLQLGYIGAHLTSWHHS